ncbi:hypothetical protein D9757_001703 [Collybiopsis confluens]|uniref:Ribosomal protein S15 n=1 Tax=Collybiopsis confluens TaxID=2823264 RepID=A0A8H5HYV5_9AGAR|nr:hypothetical protein D9757_001703 [Collybiopsis confluens]
MFRARLAQSSRTSRSSFHNSALVAASKPLTRKAKAEVKAEKWQQLNANRPDPVFGTRKGNKQLWDQCYLAKILVNEGELADPPKMTPIHLPVGEVRAPSQMGFGVTDTDAEMLFRQLPELSAQSGLPDTFGDADKFRKHLEANTKRERIKANTFARVVDLRNANADGIAYENKRRVIVAFSTPENPFDPGRTEVQAAILTYRIRNLGTHLTKFPRDLGNRLGLKKLVHHRARILKYLKRESVERYEILLEQLGLEPGSVEGELVV